MTTQPSPMERLADQTVEAVRGYVAKCTAKLAEDVAALRARVAVLENDAAVQRRQVQTLQRQLGVGAGCALGDDD